MHRSPFDLVRLFLSLFQDLPPLSRALYLPGAVLLIGYPVLSVLLGSGDHFTIGSAKRNALATGCWSRQCTIGTS